MLEIFDLGVIWQGKKKGGDRRECLTRGGVSLPGVVRYLLRRVIA